MPTLLLVNYAFAPFGGAASRRAVKLARHLSPQGWRSVVITSRRIIAPLHDPSLLREIPPDTVVIRTPTLDPIPASTDDRLVTMLRRLLNVPMVTGVGSLWAAAALPMTFAAVKLHRPQVVVCSAPDFASFLIGAAVKARFGIPLILDYRDEWSCSPIKARSAQGSLARSCKRHLETAVEAGLCAYADRVNVVSPAYVARMQEEFHLSPSKFSTLSNGYDSPEPGDVEPRPLPGADTPAGRDGDPRLRLVLLGGLAEGTLRSTLPAEMTAALAEAAAQSRGVVELHVLGHVAEGIRERLTQRETDRFKLVFQGFLPAQRAIEMARAADIRLLFGYDELPGADRCYPLKLFDYLGMRKPMLVVGPRTGVMAELACRSGLAEVFEPRDLEGMRDYVVRAFAGRMTCDPRDEVIDAYAWPALAARWRALLDEVSTGTRPDLARGAST